MDDAGMADILSPFLLVFPQDDALAFMCFAAFMGQIRQNFLEGQPGVHSSIQHIGSLLQHADPKLWRQIGATPLDRQCMVFPQDDALAFMCFAAFMGQIRQNFLEGQPGVHSSIQHIGSLLQHADPKLWRQIGATPLDRQCMVFPQDDALAFMCFAAFMGQIRQNFLEGQPGVHSSIQHIGSLLQHADPKLWRQIGATPLDRQCMVFPQDDALAFMCFAAFMGQIRQNFLEGQPGVHSSIQHIGSLLQHADPKLWRQIGATPLDRQCMVWDRLPCTCSCMPVVV